VAPKVGLRLQKLGVGGNRQLWLGRHWFDCSLWITLTLAMGYGCVRCVYMVLLAIVNCVCVGQVLLTSNIYSYSRGVRGEQAEGVSLSRVSGV
jgi:hypothetical protein